MTQYYCPVTSEPFELDDDIPWGDDGTARIVCPLHSSVTCETCWATAELMALGEYESVTEAYYVAMRKAEQRGDACTKVPRLHEITIARPVSVGFGGGDE